MTRWRPAAASASAFWGSSAPFVVSATSRLAERRQALDQHLEVAAQERLAARDPDLLDAVRDERAREPLDLLEAEELLAVHEAVAATEDLLRHAVDAAEVAAVGDRDPEVADRPAQGVECRPMSIRLIRLRVPRCGCQDATVPGRPVACADARRPRLVADGCADRRHRDLGLHVRAGAGGGRDLPAVRVPRRPIRRSRRSCSLPFAWRSLHHLPWSGLVGRRRRGRPPRDGLRPADRRARPDDGVEHGVHHRSLRRADADHRARPLPHAGCRRRLGRSRARRRRVADAERRSGRVGARQRARARQRRRAVVPDRGHGAVRAAVRRPRAHVPPDGRGLPRVHRDRRLAR